MALTDLPTIKTPESIGFIVAVSIALFIFFYTGPKAADIGKTGSGY